MNELLHLLITVLLSGLLFLAGGCGEKQASSEPEPFSMQVIPARIEDSIPGQRCILLVTVEDEGEGSSEGGAVNISATVPGASVTVEPQAITPGQVAEVTVIPGELTTVGTPVLPEERNGGDIQPVEPYMGETLTGTILGKRGELEQEETITVEVSEGEDLLASYATELREKFVQWLTVNHPELGITSETQWIGSIVRPNIVVVMYYLFFSEEWEMGLQWHVMIPPYDWAEIYLRHRTTETIPSRAFRISSLTAQDDPQAVDPPESVWR